jgi:hypothetical protein
MKLGLLKNSVRSIIFDILVSFSMFRGLLSFIPRTNGALKISYLKVEYGVFLLQD